MQQGDLETSKNAQLPEINTDVTDQQNNSPNEVDGDQDKTSTKLSEDLLTSALNHRHKIRHIMDKISMLREDDQVVSAILDKFCQIPQGCTHHC